jgi:hypothetical protein
MSAATCGSRTDPDIASLIRATEQEQLGEETAMKDLIKQYLDNGISRRD